MTWNISRIKGTPLEKNMYNLKGDISLSTKFFVPVVKILKTGENLPEEDIPRLVGFTPGPNPSSTPIFYPYIVFCPGCKRYEAKRIVEKSFVTQGEQVPKMVGLLGPTTDKESLIKKLQKSPNLIIFGRGG